MKIYPQSSFKGEALFLSTYFFSQKEWKRAEFVKHLSAEGTDSIATKVASTRLHIKPAIFASMKLGLSPRALSIRSKDQIQDIGNPRICVVGKLTSNPDKQASIAKANIKAISHLKQKGIPIAVIYSNNWCTSRQDVLSQTRSDLYRNILFLSDAIIFTTKSMIPEGMKWAQKNTDFYVIEDPWQLEIQEFRDLDSDRTCRIIWFGMDSNVDDLIRELPEIIHKCDAKDFFELTIFSNSYSFQKVATLIKKLNLEPKKPWKFRYVNWEVTKIKQELTRAHIAIIPSDPTSIFKSVASHNRVVDSLQGGCMVIASPLESYKELSKCILITTNFPGMINQGIIEFERLTKKWNLSRKNVLERFSPKANQLKWENTLLEIMK